MGCKASFGHFGEFGTPFTGVLGMNYLRTSFLSIDASGDEAWQWMDVHPTLMPNGTTVNITRNYTYHVAPLANGADPMAPRALRRFEWTQGLPNGGDHSFRLCSVFDYTQEYRAGPPDIADFNAPSGTKCFNPS